MSTEYCCCLSDRVLLLPAGRDEFNDGYCNETGFKQIDETRDCLAMQLMALTLRHAAPWIHQNWE